MISRQHPLSTIRRDQKNILAAQIKCNRTLAKIKITILPIKWYQLIRHRLQLEYMAAGKPIIAEKTHEIPSKNIQNKEIKKGKAHRTMSLHQAKRKIKRARVADYSAICLISTNLTTNVAIKPTTTTTTTTSTILMISRARANQNKRVTSIQTQ